MKAEILDASVQFYQRPFITPLVLSSGPITEITEARVAVTVRADGKEATGRGAIYLSDLWAWPDPRLDHSFRDAALRKLTTQIAEGLRDFCGGEPHHPLELGMRLHDRVTSADTPVPTILARAMCASPFDAAIHDAAGIALGCCALDFYVEDFPAPSADRYFTTYNAAAAIRQTLTPARHELEAWLIVSGKATLDPDFASTIRKRCYRCFKLKTTGRSLEDADSTIAMFTLAKRAGVQQPWISVDSNEANVDTASVLDYLLRLRRESPEAFAALRYLEQPTNQDIRAHRHDWHEVAALKAVLLDEGLTSLELLPEAKADGWSGLALKTCKGHSFALVAAAWARQHGMLLSMQDLTNPGFAAIHSALLASRLDTINGVEINSPQFTPDANAEWLPRLEKLFHPRDGLHRLPEIEPVGLGSTL